MTPRIDTLHWALLAPGIGAGWVVGGATSVALWPAPVDHDQCLLAAGFTSFADTDEAWDKHFIEMTKRLLESLSAIGAPRLRTGEFPRIPRKEQRELAQKFGWTTPDTSLVIPLVAAARDDNFPPCLVEFGPDRKAAVCTSDGHPIWWACIPQAFDLRRVLHAVGRGYAICETALRLDALVPMLAEQK